MAVWVECGLLMNDWDDCRMEDSQSGGIIHHALHSV